MLKLIVPLGLITGVIAITGLTTPNIRSISTPTFVQAQLRDDQFGDAMTQATLESILNEIAEDVNVNNNQILFMFDGQPLLLITDERANRMRIVSPIVKTDEINGEEMEKMMLANFHTALDGRYAISNGVVYATFIHPLSTLDANDFRSAVSQVASLRQTYGSTYNSGSGLFGVPATGTTDSLPAI